MRLPRARRLAFRTISQIGIAYRDSALSVVEPDFPKDAPRAGDRFPWLHLKLVPGGPTLDMLREVSDQHFNLIVVGQEVPQTLATDLGDLCRVYSVPSDAHNAGELASAHIPSPSFYLLRPDGHVGLCGARLTTEAATNYLLARLKLSAQTAIDQLQLEKNGTRPGSK